MSDASSSPVSSKHLVSVSRLTPQDGELSKERTFTEQPDSKKNPKNFGGLLRVIATAFSIFIISQAIAIFFVSVALAFIHPHVNAGNILNDSAGAQFAYIFIAEALAAALVLKIIRTRGLSLKAIGLGRKPKWNDVLKAALGFLAFYALLIIITTVATLLIPSLNTNQTQDVGFNNLAGSFDYILALMALVILPPLGEETLMRGYLYSGLRSRWTFFPAMLLTSLLFGLAHLNTGSGSATLWIAGIDTFLLSVVLVYLREKTGALYACMLVHSLNNLVAFGIHFHGTMF